MTGYMDKKAAVRGASPAPRATDAAHGSMAPSAALAGLARTLHASPGVVTLQRVQTTLNASSGGNRTGLPDRLKAGVESLSGMSLDDVRVHRNAAAPARIQAHAFTQGTDIHMAPGQEKHLAHEAWHVVQQKQGRVKPTLQLRGIGINDSEALEREADRMGARALGAGVVAPSSHRNQGAMATSSMIVQRVKKELKHNDQAIIIDISVIDKFVNFIWNKK